MSEPRGKDNEYSDEAEANDSRSYVQQKKGAKKAPPAQFTPGMRVWLKDGNDVSPMKVDQKHLNPGTNKWEYQISYEGEPYNNGQWVPESRLKRG